MRFKSVFSKPFTFPILLSLITASVLSLVFLAGFFSPWQTKLTDELFASRSPHSDIAIIAIDNQSLQTLGRWPWSRSLHAQLLKQLGTHPAAIGFDITFSEPTNEEQDAAFEQALKQNPDIVLATKAQAKQTKTDQFVLENPLKPISRFAATTSTGIVTVWRDSDGVVRNVPIKLRSSESPFSVEVLEHYYYNIFKKSSEKIKLLSALPLEKGKLRINFVGRPNTFPHYRYTEVLSGKIDPKTFEDKIVLIGATAPDLHDTYLTPTSDGIKMAEVEIHANTIQTLLERKFLLNENRFTTVITLFILSFIIATLFLFRSIRVATIGAIVLLILYLEYSFISLNNGTIRNIVFPAFVIILSHIVHLSYRHIRELTQKLFILKALKFHVSPSVLQKVLKDPSTLKLGGERKTMTVLFSDVAGFTSISEKIDPEDLSELLNRYLTAMTKIVFENGGFLDKYIGDTVMAFWGAPVSEADHALKACQTALHMQKEIEGIRNDWKAVGVDNFDVQIGINSGEMIVGNMGSRQHFDYTVIGNNVNLAARLKEINKEYGTKLIISEHTYNLVKDEVTARLLDIVEGKEQGMAIYELRAMGQPEGEEAEFLEQFERARHLYHEGQFAQALELFTEIHNRFPSDHASQTYIQHCEEFIVKIK